MSIRFLGLLIIQLISGLPLLGQHSLAIDSLQHELLKAKSDEDKIKITLLLSDQMRESSPLLALEYATESVLIARKINSDSLLARSYVNQANIYLHLGNYPRSLQLYQNAIAVAQKIGSQDIIYLGYGSLGKVYYYQHDYDNALKYYLEALGKINVAANPAKNQLKRKASILNNIGIIYEQTKRFQNASRYYNEALKLGEQAGDNEIIANVTNNIGTVYRDLGDNALAFKYYTAALALRKKYKFKLGIARSYHNIGWFYFKPLNQLDSAEGYLKQSIALAKEIGSWETVDSADSLLYEVYNKKGDYKNAFEVLKQYNQVHDSLFNTESTRRIAQLEMQFEFDRQQSLLEVKQKEKELYTWMGGGALTFLLIIVTLLFFLQRSKTRRSELEQAQLQLEQINLKNNLAVKDKELAANIMYLLNKNELINSMSEKLLEIKNQLSAENQPAIQKVVLDLQSNLQPELWQEFEFRFQQVHEQFYKALNEKFPDLSPSDRRLCAFLKLNMTTKEISAITHQNAKSIDVARTRLRKKLSLTGTDHNLVSFLSQLDNSDSANHS